MKPQETNIDVTRLPLYSDRLVGTCRQGGEIRFIVIIGTRIGSFEGLHEACCYMMYLAAGNGLITEEQFSASEFGVQVDDPRSTVLGLVTEIGELTFRFDLVDPAVITAEMERTAVQVPEMVHLDTLPGIASKLH